MNTCYDQINQIKHFQYKLFGGIIMKKILIMLLILAISTSAFCINIKIINNTNASGGWKTKIEHEGLFITKYRHMKRKNNEANFNNIPLDSTIQIISTKNIGKGTAISSSKITLRKDLYEEEINTENITITIKECDSETTQCKSIMSEINSSPETTSEGNSGQNNKYYYVKIE